MTLATQILDDLAAAGVTLRAEGERLRFHPVDRVTPEQVAELKAHKAELLAILTTTVRCPWCRSTDLVDDPQGIRCRSCRRLAWLSTPEGGTVRADRANERLVQLNPPTHLSQSANPALST